MVRRMCSGGEGERKKRDLKKFGTLVFVMVVWNHSGPLNGDEESAADIWFEAGKWIQTFFIVQQPVMG
jgi:hypothetical protein